MAITNHEFLTRVEQTLAQLLESVSKMEQDLNSGKSSSTAISTNLQVLENLDQWQQRLDSIDREVSEAEVELQTNLQELGQLQEMMAQSVTVASSFTSQPT